MNKLEKKLIKKIIASLFIANLALVTSNSCCMMTVFTRSASKAATIQRRGFGSVPILSRERYNALCKKIKEDDQKLHRLSQDHYLNPNAMDIVRRRRSRNLRILKSCQIEPSADLFDDANQ